MSEGNTLQVVYAASFAAVAFALWRVYAAGRRRSRGAKTLLRHPVRRGFLWGAASVACLGLVVLLVHSSVRPTTRRGSVLRESMIARAESGPNGGRPSPSSTPEARLEAMVGRDPENVDVRLELARIYLLKEDRNAAVEQIREVLKRSPENPRALTYLGVMRSTAGQPEVAVPLFQRAIAKNPDLMEAYVQLAYAYVRLDRGPDAEATLAIASRRFPDKAAVLSRLLERWNRQSSVDLDGSRGPPSEQRAP